jgi:hypothetical protein
MSNYDNWLLSGPGGPFDCADECPHCEEMLDDGGSCPGCGACYSEHDCEPPDMDDNPND